MASKATGTWKNQRGSILELKESHGVISGRFESGVGDDGTTLWVNVSGQAFGDLLSFSAVYTKYKTIVAWVGQITEDGGKDQIQAQWLHTSDIPDDQEKEWMWFVNRIGADVFVRQ